MVRYNLEVDADNGGAVVVTGSLWKGPGWLPRPFLSLVDVSSCCGLPQHDNQHDSDDQE
jgi:hypothetical protein